MSESPPLSKRQQTLLMFDFENRPVVSALFQLLDVPQSNQSLDLAMRHLQDLVPLIKKVLSDSAEEFPSEMDVALASINTLVKTKHNTTGLISPAQRTKDPMWGVISEHQLYSALPYLSPFEVPHQLLRAQLYAASIILLYRSPYLASDEIVKSVRGARHSIDMAAMSIRTLASHEDLRHFPNEALDGRRYLAALKEIDPVLLWEGNRDYLEHIIYALNKVWGESAEDVFQRPIHRAIDLAVVDTPVIVHTQRAISLGQVDAIEARKSGIAQIELADDEEFALLQPDPDEPVVKEMGYAELAIRRKHQVAQLERANQMLPSGWNRISNQEVAEFYLILHAEWKKFEPDRRKSRKDAKQQQLAQLPILIIFCLSFWLSRSLKEAAQLQLYACRDDVTGSMPSVGYVKETQEWVFPAARPKASQRFSGIADDQAITRSMLLFLPAPLRVVRLLNALETVKNLPSSGTCRAFPDELDQPGFKPWQEALSTQSLGRLTPSRIENFMLLEIASRTNDFALACMSLGLHHRLGDTQLHYAVFDADTLRNQYAESCRHVESLMHDEFAVRHPNRQHQAMDVAGNTEGKSDETRQVFGSPICPLTDTVTRLQSEIAKAHKKMLMHPGRPGFVVAHHNLLTLYTTFLLKFATGIRDVASPLPNRDHFDLEDETFYLSDKDNVAAFHARVLPIPALLKKQLAAYDDHLRILLGHATLLDPELARQIHLLLTNDHSDLQVLFFLKQTGGTLKIEEVRSKTLLEQLKAHAPWFALPTNFNRSYLRRRLVELGCPSESVDYLLGHWVRAREPLARFGTLPIDAHLSVLREKLDVLLYLDGWSVVRGYT